MRIIKSVIFAIVALAFTGCNKETVPSTGNRELDRITVTGCNKETVPSTGNGEVDRITVTGCNKETVPSTGNRELDRIIAKIEKGRQPTAQEQQVINEAILDGNSALIDMLPQERRASIQELHKRIAAHPELKSQILNHLRGQI
jgi:hypothetical protein